MSTIYASGKRPFIDVILVYKIDALLPRILKGNRTLFGIAYVYSKSANLPYPGQCLVDLCEFLPPKFMS